MDGARTQVLAEARKLLRALGSAPDPHRQAQAAVALLLRSGPWGAAGERQILDLASWLAERPPPEAIKPRCQSVLKALDGADATADQP
jgi:hypothetical protein